MRSCNHADARVCGCAWMHMRIQVPTDKSVLERDISDLKISIDKVMTGQVMPVSFLCFYE